MKAIILLACLASVSSVPGYLDRGIQRVAECEEIEINEYRVTPGAEVANFTQVIFWGKDGRVQDWCFYKKEFFLVTDLKIEWKVGFFRYCVYGVVKRTVTFHDPGSPPWYGTIPE